jgi:DNA-binding response OmpR family regulator
MGNILVVDDDETICELLDIALTDEGHEVRCAQTIGRALELIRERAPDVILFDMRLPDGDGGQLVARYRELPHTGARLIAVSAISNLREEAAEIGVDAALSKPFDLENLLTLVDGSGGV